MKKTVLLMTMILGILNPIRAEAAISTGLPSIRTGIVYSSEEYIGEEHIYLHYLAKEGESLDIVSARFALGKEYLHTVNPEYEIGMKFSQNTIITLPESIYWPDVAGKLYYWISKGDTLTKISEYFGSSISELLELNPQIKNPDLIYTGKLIRVV